MLVGRLSGRGHRAVPAGPGRRPGHHLQRRSSRPARPSTPTPWQGAGIGNLGLKLVVEPGRAIVGNAGHAGVPGCCSPRTPRPSTLSSSDAGMNDLVRPAMYDSYHAILAREPGRGAAPKPDLATWWGPSARPATFWPGTVDMPDLQSVASWLAAMSAGAYGFSMASTYNSRPRAAEVHGQRRPLVPGAAARDHRRAHARRNACPIGWSRGPAKRAP